MVPTRRTSDTHFSAKGAYLFTGFECFTGSPPLPSVNATPWRSYTFVGLYKVTICGGFFALYRTTKNSAVFALDTPKLWTVVPSNGPTLYRDMIDPRVNGNFERYFATNNNEVIWVGEPEQMDRRLVAQSGTFVVPGVLDKTLEEVIQQYEEGDTLIKKIVLPPSIREEAMLSLYRMNIPHATLFPDLDGLSRSIGYELEITWPGYKAL